jgi:hypothetical protein
MKVTTNARSPLPGMNVSHIASVFLSSDEVDRVFWSRLADLTDKHFIRDGELFRLDEDPRGNIDHSFIGKLSVLDMKEEWSIVLAACRLRQAISEAAI